MQQSEAQGWHKNQRWHKVLRQKNFAVNIVMNIVMGCIFFYLFFLSELERWGCAPQPVWLFHSGACLFSWGSGLTGDTLPCHHCTISALAHRTDEFKNRSTGMLCQSCCFRGPALCRDFSIKKTVKHLVNLHNPYFIFLQAPEIPANVTMLLRAKFHTLPPHCPLCLAERVSLFNMYSVSFLLFT